MDAPVSGEDITSGIADVFATAPGGSKDTSSDTTLQADTPGGEAPSPAPSPAPGSPTTPGGEGPSAVDPNSPYQLSEDGNSYIVPKTEIPVLNGFKEYAQKVQQRFPTANDAEIAHIQAADYRGLRADFLSGDENSIQNVLTYFAGQHQGLNPEERQQFQNSFAMMAQKMPEILKSVNPQAYSQLNERVIHSQIDAAYQKAAETGDETDMLLAQSLDWSQTGQYKTELPKTDPAALAQQQFTAQQQALQAREAAAYNRDFKYFNDTAMDGPKWNAFSAEIAKTLAPVKDKYDPALFEDLQKVIGDKVIKKLKADYEWSRDHNNDRTALERAYKNLWQSNQSSNSLKPRLQAYNNDFMARVRRELPSIAASYLGKATATAVAKTQPAPKTTSQPQQPAAPARNPQGQFQKQTQEPYDIYSDVKAAMGIQ